MDKQAKKRVLQRIPYGAYVVGTKTAEDGDHFMFLTWMTQSSFKPPLVAVALLDESRTLANVRRTKRFAVTLLRPGLEDVAQRVLDEAFDALEVERTPSGLPVVAQGAGWFECDLVEVLERGDHHIVLGEVVEVAEGSGRLLRLDELGWNYAG